MMKRAAAVFSAVIAMSSAARADDEEESDESADEGEKDEKAGKAGKADKAEKASKEDAGDKSESEAEDKSGEAEEQPAAEATAKAAGRMTLPGGKFYINGVIETNLASGAAGKPISIAPDLWYGAGDKLTLGLVHSGRGATGFLTGIINGICVNGGSGGGVCASGLGKIYTTAGAEARIAITEGGFALALPIGLYATAFKPEIVLSAKIGLIGRYQAGSVAIELQPTLFAGLTQRKIDMAGVKVSNNEERFGLPVTLFFKLSPAFALAAQTGITMVVAHAKDTYPVPAAIGLAWWASPRLSVDFAFGLGAVVDANSMTKAFDSRNLTVGVGYGM
jgi:hypothetical protein